MGDYTLLAGAGASGVSVSTGDTAAQIWRDFAADGTLHAGVASAAGSGAIAARARSVLGYWVGVRRLSHLFLFLTAYRMVLPKILALTLFPPPVAPGLTVRLPRPKNRVGGSQLASVLKCSEWFCAGDGAWALLIWCHAGA